MPAILPLIQTAAKDECKASEIFRKPFLWKYNGNIRQKKSATAVIYHGLKCDVGEKYREIGYFDIKKNFRLYIADVILDIKEG